MNLQRAFAAIAFSLVLVVKVNSRRAKPIFYSGFEIPNMQTVTSTNTIADQCDIPIWSEVSSPETVNYHCETIRVEDIESAQQFHDLFIENRKPVRIRARSFSKLHWNMSAWTMEELKRRIGHHFVLTESVAPDVMFGQKGRREAMSFSEFVDRVDGHQEGQDLYYLNLQGATSNALSPPLSYLTNSFTTPHFFSTLPLNKINMWFGNAGVKGASSELHFDAPDNLYMLVKGKKRFRFYSPSEAFRMYLNGRVFRVESDGYIHYNRTAPGPKQEAHFSQVNPDDIDLRRFPKFRDTTVGECDLEEGDMLYLPGGWFHHVTSYGLNLAVNFWANYVPDQ